MRLLNKYQKHILISLFILVYSISYSFRLQNIDFNQRMDTSDGGYREFYIKNDNLARQRYKINLLSGDKNDGSKFIEIYPKVITIDANSRGIVKVFAKAPKTTPKGEYNFKLQFQPINIPTLAKQKDGMAAGTSNIGIAPIIDLKGYVGEPNFKENIQLNNIVVLKNTKGKGIVVKGDLSNNSHASLDFAAEAYGNGEFLYGTAHVGNVLKNTKSKQIQLVFPMIKDPKDLKKIALYRTPSNVREVIKVIDIK